MTPSMRSAPGTSERPDTSARSAELLRALAGDDATLRPDQGEAITALVDDRARVLLVQATGWGKSAVYWVATALLREQGAGPTLVVSPLLALMRNQVEAAGRLGLRAATINSANREEWDATLTALDRDAVDVLLISPERLNAPSFRDRVAVLAARTGLVVVDEAHSISEWGHDFRPDYRRLRDLLVRLPAGTPVLACTATANARVTADVARQLRGPSDGAAVSRTLRGALGRASLRLAVVQQPDAQHRLAWLAAYLAEQRPVHGRAGVVYTLTVADAERTADFLTARGSTVAAYTGSVDAAERTRLERALAANEVDALVATSALGMGYDKPDLAFVVHLGAPSSPIAYYQQIGRAGRALDDADVVLLPTGAQEAIWEHFDVAGVPTRRESEELLAALDVDAPTSVGALERIVNLRRSRLELLLKVLDVDGAVAKVGSGWVRTGRAWAYDDDRYRGLVQARRSEHAAMRSLSAGQVEGCLMAFLRDALDDPAAEPCGRCQHCAGWAPDVSVRDADLTAARELLRTRDVVLRARRRWPVGIAEVRGNIAPERRPAEGRALAGGDDSGWGPQVRTLLGLALAERLDGAQGSQLLDDVVIGLTRVLARWPWEVRPVAVAVVPSLATTDTAPRLDALTRRLAQRIGELGRLPVVDALGAVDGPAQTAAANSAHRAANALARLVRTDATLPSGPVLAMAAEVDTGWTMTVAAWRLTGDQPRRVLPLALTSGP